MVHPITAPRCEFAVIIPSTNTSVEAEFNWLRVPGVSFHAGRILIPAVSLSDDAAQLKVSENLRTEIVATVRSVMTCNPDYLVMGMSAETFWGGKAGATAFVDRMNELTGGLGITTGAEACRAALDAYGARTIGIITPYRPIADQHVYDYFTQMGYVVKGLYGMSATSMAGIADITTAEMEEAFLQVDGPDVDLLLQVGTNLACVKCAAEMEVRLGKPVVAINAATVWHAYRANGIMDQIEGFGSLMAEH